MKVETALAVAKEIFDGILPAEDFIEGEENECVRKIVIDEFNRLLSVSDKKDRVMSAKQEMDDKPIWRKGKAMRTWGTPMLDDNLPPVQDDTYCLLAGKAKKGKTTFLLDVAIKNANSGVSVLFYSLEMTTKQLLTRYAMGIAGIGIPEFRKKEFKPGQLDTYREAYNYLSNMDNLIIIGKDPDHDTIDDHFKQISDVNPGLCILDNLGLIRFKGSEIDGQAYASREIAAFCKEHQIPIILVHHLNKEDKQGRSSIRGTQKLVDDPDLIMLITRKDWADCSSEQEKKEVYLKVEADRWFNQGGKTFTVLFEKETYKDLSQPGFL